MDNRRWVGTVVLLAALVPFGSGCDETSAPCSGVNCSGHGQCIQSGSAAVCQCFDAYHPSDADPLVCLPDPADAADADADDAEEADANHCGNGVIEPEFGEVCDTEPQVCGDCHVGTAQCDPVTCTLLECVGDPGPQRVCHDDPAHCEDCYRRSGGACTCPDECHDSASCTGAGEEYCMGWSDPPACNAVDPAGCSAAGWCVFYRQHKQICEMQCP